MTQVKIELLEKLGLENVIIHPFTKEFSQTEASDFVKSILVDRLKVKRLVIGYDHHFGKGRSGSFEQLKKESETFGFDLEEIPAKELEQINISSSKIRNALKEGAVDVANNYLGYPYFMRGTVIKGQQLGRKINFPTANIYIEEKYKLIPYEGVYAVDVFVNDKKHIGMLNIGHRPTLPGK